MTPPIVRKGYGRRFLLFNLKNAAGLKWKVYICIWNDYNIMDKGQFLLYQTPDGDSQIEVKLQNDTVWLSLDQMAELFQRNKSTISRHINNVLEDG